MKKILLSLLVLFFAAPFLRAVQADPTPFKYVQPDGSVIILQNHGDEYFHWLTNYSTGQVVAKMADGFYRPVNKNLTAEAAKAQKLRAEKLYGAWSSFDDPPATNFGDRKVLCILASFSDVDYSVADPKQHFKDMLNMSGYSGNGAIGSVRDYFIENSMNLYRPQFDVYGPVTLSNNEQYYDDNGVHLAILEAYDLLKSEISIGDYDTDGDGNIDMVLFYFPGHNEAEGGANTTIWPHQSTGGFGTMGGKNFIRYFCTSELSGASGTTPASIGTTCHEFSHSLGLPDFYDVDYANSGGQNTTTGPFDLMASGNYNDGGRRPPYLSAVERNMLGWMPAPPVIISSGDYTLEPVQNNKAYQINSAVSGEYFVVEYRNGYKWDSTLPSGTVVYHIDKSDRIVDTGNGYSAGYLWENTNAINNFYGHPCYYVVPTSVSASSWNQYVFPGYDTVTTYLPEDWNGNSAGLSLTGIADNGTNSTFTVLVSSHRTVVGVVTDTDGNPLKDVQVSLTPSTGPFTPAPSLLSGSIFCMTDADGKYSLELDDSATENQILRAEKDGYTASSFNLSISSLFTARDMVLLRTGEGVPADLCKYDSSLSLTGLGLGSGSSVAAGMRYTAAELTSLGLAGSKLKTVTFLVSPENSESVYVVVDVGGSMTLRQDVTGVYTPGGFTTIDVSSANIILPDDQDVFIGVGVKDIVSGYPFRGFGVTSTDNGGCYVNWDFMTSAGSSMVDFGTDTYYNFAVSATLSTTADIEFSTYGVSYIKVESDIPTVKVAAGKSLKTTEWTVDGASVVTPTAISALASGSHVYMARLTYYDGTVERVYYEVDK